MEEFDEDIADETNPLGEDEEEIEDEDDSEILEDERPDEELEV